MNNFEYISRGRVYKVNHFRTIQNKDKGLIKQGHNKTQHRKIHDASRSRPIFMLSLKLNRRYEAIKIDPRNSSQRCSCQCRIVKKRLSERVHDFPSLQLSSDRDYNAAVNILFAMTEKPATLQ